MNDVGSDRVVRFETDGWRTEEATELGLGLLGMRKIIRGNLLMEDLLG